MRGKGYGGEEMKWDGWYEMKERERTGKLDGKEEHKRE